MLKIIVSGNGMIPRGFGLAPRKDPVEVDLKTLKVIVYTKTLEVYAINPITGAKVLTTPVNYEKNYKLMASEYASNQQKKEEVVHVTKPVAPAPKVQIPKPEPVKPEMPIAPPVVLAQEPENAVSNAIQIVEVPKEQSEDIAPLPVITNQNNQNNKHKK